MCLPYKISYNLSKNSLLIEKSRHFEKVTTHRKRPNILEKSQPFGKITNHQKCNNPSKNFTTVWKRHNTFKKPQSFNVKKVSTFNIIKLINIINWVLLNKGIIAIQYSSLGVHAFKIVYVCMRVCIQFIPFSYWLDFLL